MIHNKEKWPRLIGSVLVMTLFFCVISDNIFSFRLIS